MIRRRVNKISRQKRGRLIKHTNDFIGRKIRGRIKNSSRKVIREVIVSQSEKNVLFEEFADMSNRMNILIVKNTEQIARNSQNLNIQYNSESQDCVIASLKEM
jgi:hypothetical protein